MLAAKLMTRTLKKWRSSRSGLLDVRRPACFLGVDVSTTVKKWVSVPKKRRPNRKKPVRMLGIAETSQSKKWSPGLAGLHKTCTARAATATKDISRENHSRLGLSSMMLGFGDFILDVWCNWRWDWTEIERLSAKDEEKMTDTAPFVGNLHVATAPCLLKFSHRKVPWSFGAFTMRHLALITRFLAYMPVISWHQIGWEFSVLFFPKTSSNPSLSNIPDLASKWSPFPCAGTRNTYISRPTNLK